MPRCSHIFAALLCASSFGTALPAASIAVNAVARSDVETNVGGFATFLPTTNPLETTLSAASSADGIGETTVTAEFDPDAKEFMVNSRTVSPAFGGSIGATAAALGEYDASFIAEGDGVVSMMWFISGLFTREGPANLDNLPTNARFGLEATLTVNGVGLTDGYHTRTASDPELDAGNGMLQKIGELSVTVQDGDRIDINIFTESATYVDSLPPNVGSARYADSLEFLAAWNVNTSPGVILGDADSVAPVPLPASALLLGSGALGLGLMRRRKRGTASKPAA